MPRYVREVIRQIERQGWLVWVHCIDMLQRMLGNDVLSVRLRVSLLRLLGVRMGKGCKIMGGSYFHGGRIRLGENVLINRNGYFDCSDTITIGARSMIGNGVTFVTAQHALGEHTKRCGSVSPKPISVGEGVWICANVTILPNVTIGDGAVIAAGSVVHADVKADSLVGGVPARVIREL